MLDKKNDINMKPIVELFNNNEKTTKIILDKIPFIIKKKRNGYRINWGKFIDISLTNNGADMEYSFNIYPENANDVRDVISGFLIYESFLKKRLLVNKDEQFFVCGSTAADNSIEEIKAIKETVEVWNNIKCLQDKIGKKFNPKKIMENQDKRKFYVLYTSLVLSKPYKENVDVGEITARGSLLKNLEEVKGKPGFSFLLVQDDNIDLWGVRIRLYAASGLFNLKLMDCHVTKKISDNLVNMKIDVAPVDNEKSYLSRRMFLSQADAKKYIDEHKDDLKNAKSLNDLIKSIVHGK